MVDHNGFREAASVGAWRRHFVTVRLSAGIEGAEEPLTLPASPNPRPDKS
jgi:hypothetical protein